MGQYAFRLVVVTQDIEALGLTFRDDGFRFVGSVEHVNDNWKDGPGEYRPHVHRVGA